MKYIDPYHRFGLRRNPFATEENVNWLEASWIDRGLSSPPPVRASLFVQIQGPEGSGKTSQLLSWQRCTNGAYISYSFCRRFRPFGRWRIPPVNAIAYWDDAQIIPWPLLLLALTWAALCHSTIVVATHADLSWMARWLGLHVQTFEIPELDTETLLHWAHLHIRAARLHEPIEPGLHPTSEVMAQVLAKSNHSWRAAGHYLHAWAAATVG
jgi:hypothetical protein